MTDDKAELIEALGGGDVGWDRLARLKQLAGGCEFAGKCMFCKRWFVFEEFKRAVVGAPAVPIGPANLGGCGTCLWPNQERQSLTGHFMK